MELDRAMRNLANSGFSSGGLAETLSVDSEYRLPQLGMALFFHSPLLLGAVGAVVSGL